MNFIERHFFETTFIELSYIETTFIKRYFIKIVQHCKRFEKGNFYMNCTIEYGFTIMIMFT